MLSEHLVEHLPDGSGHILPEVYLPGFDNSDAQSFQQFELPIVSVHAFSLDRMLDHRVNSGVCMPEGSVHLQAGVLLWEEEVQGCREASSNVSDGVLPNEAGGVGSLKSTGDSVLQLGHAAPRLIGQVAGSGKRKLGSGLRGVLEQAVSVSERHDLSTRCHHRSSASFCVSVGFRDNALGRTLAAPSIVASLGAELATVFGLCSHSRSPHELRSAGGTGVLFGGHQATDSQLVRALSGAGGLTPVLESACISLVSLGADWTRHFYDDFRFLLSAHGETCHDAGS